MPFPPEYDISLASHDPRTVETKVLELMAALELQWQYNAALHQGIGFANGNVWSRAARRSKRSQVDAGRAGHLDKPPEDDDQALGFRLSLQERDNGAVVDVRWLLGTNSVLYESFCGMLRRRLTT